MAVSLSAAPAVPRVCATYGTRRAPNWRYDVPAIERALDLLGVRAPVRIYLSESKRGRWSGSAYWDEQANEHVIMLARWLSPAGASRTLWHELTHSLQFERGDELYTSLSSSARARIARSSHERYLELPGEREAAENERYAQDHPLVTSC